MGIADQKRVQLLKREVQTGTDGRRVPGTTQTYNLWAEVTSLSGSRDYNQQTQLTATRRFKVRFKFNLHPNCDWLVKYNGNEYTVSEILRVDERRFYWQFTGTAKSSEVNV